MNDGKKKAEKPLEVKAIDETKVVDIPSFHLDAKQAEETGDLSKDLADLRENVRFETRVMFIGFAVIFVAVGLFVVQAFVQSNTSYNSIQAKIATLQAEVHILSNGKF